MIEWLAVAGILSTLMLVLTAWMWSKEGNNDDNSNV